MCEASCTSLEPRSTVVQDDRDPMVLLNSLRMYLYLYLRRRLHQKVYTVEGHCEDFIIGSLGFVILETNIDDVLDPVKQGTSRGGLII